MSYITPKTDWIPADGISNEDLNRIEGNIKAVKDEDLTLTGNKILEGNIIQPWGYDGIPNRPPLTSGMTTIISRIDSEREIHNLEDTNWHTLRTLTLSQHFPAGSTLSVYWQDEDDDTPYHDVRLLVNGSQYYLNTNEDGGYFARTLHNVPAGPNYSYSVQMRAATGNGYADLKIRYFRLWANEILTLTTWEKATFGLTG